MSSVLREDHPKQVIDARHRFLKRCYDHEFEWKPSRKIEGEIMADTFGHEVREKGSDNFLKSGTAGSSSLSEIG